MSNVQLAPGAALSNDVWEYNDGGREAAGFKGNAGDCVTRAIAIASELPYLEVYNQIGELVRANEKIATSRKAHGRSLTARNGVVKAIWKPYIESLGWTWTPTMGIGTGATVHLRADELPSGRIIVRASKHLCAVIDGVIQDTHDPSRGGTRCVYGYFTKR